MGSNQRLIGMGTFVRRVGLSPPVVRGLEAAGVVSPLRADSGWRMFSEADVRAALQWKTQRNSNASPERTDAGTDATAT